MTSFIKRVFIFLSIFFILYFCLSIFLLPIIIKKTGGPTTLNQIKQSFSNALKNKYSLVILGNSKTYRGINPDIINIKSYNFSHDNDSYNQIYYKLLWLQENKIKIKYLILGVDYFQFSYISDSRNYAYNQYLNSDYKKDFPKSNLITDFYKKTEILQISRLQYLKNIFNPDTLNTYLKTNGQYIKPGYATINDSSDSKIIRIKIQEIYFSKILDNCKRNKIQIFLCMLPYRNKVLNSFNKEEILEFEMYLSNMIKLKNEKTIYLNYSSQQNWKLEDFTDIVHFNESAANRFTMILNDTINSILNSKNVQQF